MILLDTSGLLAAIDASQGDHEAARAVLNTAEPRILSPFVLAELDYLLLVRVGQAAELAFLEEVQRGAYRLDGLSTGKLVRCGRSSPAMPICTLNWRMLPSSCWHSGYNCLDVLTLDQRHFRTVLGPGEMSFRLLPADVG